MFGNNQDPKLTEQQEKAADKAEIKRAIIESASKSNLNPVELSEGLILAFKQIDAHYSLSSTSQTGESLMFP